MLKSLFKKISLIIYFIILSACTLQAITPYEIYNDAKTQFALGHWLEAKELFDKFLNIWPNHNLAVKAKYFRAVSQLKARDRILLTRKEQELASLTKILNLTKEKMPNFDTTELELALKSKESARFFVEDLIKLDQDKLRHVITRQQYPNPFEYPLLTVKWIHKWVSENKKIAPDLYANLLYIKALALWQIMLSPLSKNSNASILKVWRSWPVHKALEEALEMSFSRGNPSLKRKVALLGFHYEYFLHNSLNEVKKKYKYGKWYKYLSNCGIDPGKVWCPR